MSARDLDNMVNIYRLVIVSLLGLANYLAYTANGEIVTLRERQTARAEFMEAYIQQSTVQLNTLDSRMRRIEIRLGAERVVPMSNSIGLETFTTFPTQKGLAK